MPTLPNLQKIDIKENQIANVKEFGKLKFPLLTKIIVTTNPCAEELGPGIKTDLLILLEDFNIKFINKEEVTKEDRDEAANVKQERIKKEAEELEERLRLEKEKAEEEEKLRAEREEEERQKGGNAEPEMKDLGNISGIDGEENMEMGGDFGDENM